MPPQWLCTVVLGAIGVWVSSQPIAVLVLFLIFSFFDAGCNTLTAIYPAEVFPTEARGIGTGFAAAVSRIGTGVVTFLFALVDVSRRHLRDDDDCCWHRRSRRGVVAWRAPEAKVKSLTETAAGYTH
ncbi:MFS transporter [Burkholderia cepacia]|uniref:MFS transporter n=1 Tax=Burkholderia cepacia TaxID=292 RepID=UPI001E39F370|nr:MFS transporter [Burkholderia cepacia]